MNRKLGHFLVCLVALVATTSFAQTSPWPFSSPASKASTSSGGHSVTIAFWNIQWFPGSRPDASANEENQQINAVHSDIKKLNADVIGMEEVRNWDKAGLAVQQLRGFKVDVCANFPPREGQKEAQEVAITSRLQPVSAWAEVWKAAQPLTPPRGFAFAAYEVAPHQLLLVYCVHLKSNRGDVTEMQGNIGMREESVRQLLSHAAAMEKAYSTMGALSWVIGGDFNTSLDDPKFAKEKTLNILRENGFLWAWQNIPASTRMTLPPDKGFPATCFDHIFYRGANLRSAAVINTAPQSSDHRAVVATFDLPSSGR